MKNAAQKKSSRRLNPLSEAHSLVIGCGLALTLLAATILFAPPQLLTFLNYRVYDLLLSTATLPAPSGIPVLVGIDDRSLESYGQWPWPRYRLAQLVTRLKQAGADVVALDMLMPEVDRTSPEVIVQERLRDLDEAIQTGAPLLERRLGNDEVLAQALAQTTTVLSYKFLFPDVAISTSHAEPAPLKNIVTRSVPGDITQWPAPGAVLGSLESFSEVASDQGFTNVRADADGVLRRAPLLMHYRDGYYPNLALAAIRLAEGQAGVLLEIKKQEAVLQWADRKIPLDESGQLLIAYSGEEQSFVYYSAADVLDAGLPEGTLDGKIAFVGAWASGLGDRHVTPFNRSTPGLKIHAVIASNILTGKFLHQPSWARGAELFFVLFIGIISTLLIARFGFVADLLLVLVGSVFPFAGAFLMFNMSGIYIPPVAPLLLLLVNCSLLGLVRYGVEVRKVYLRTRDLMEAQDTTILGMVSLSEARDEETGEHILRTQRYVEALAKQLGTLDKYRKQLTDEDVELLFKSAPLHDIGKVGIPDRILLKPGKLTDEEYTVMKTHPVIGARALANTLGNSDHVRGGAYLDYAREVAIAHHEKWDGSGYPNGLQGEAIPLAGRLMALADVYDALISKRVYKPAFPHEKAREMIVAERGVHFDPDVVDAFLAQEEVFKAVAARYGENS